MTGGSSTSLVSPALMSSRVWSDSGHTRTASSAMVVPVVTGPVDDHVKAIK